MTIAPRLLLSALALSALVGCQNATMEPRDNDHFGESVTADTQLMSGQRNYAIELGQRFATDVPNTVNFAFNRSYLDDRARAVLNQQANFIRQFPEVRFRVFGYTDKVGTEGYNKSLGMRRARAVVNYLVSQGISRSRLQAVISYGETRPLVDTPAPERANRRAVTSVSGFVQSNPMVLNGKYAAVIFREYVKSAVPGDTLKATSTAATNGGG